jgi:hypothetical protein
MLADADLVAVGQKVLSNETVVNSRAIGRTQIDQRIGVAIRPKLGMAPRNVRIIEIDRTLRHPADDRDSVAERDAPTVCQLEERGSGVPACALDEGGLDPEATSDQLLFFGEGHPDPAEETKASFLGVLANSACELETERVLDLGKSCVVGGRQTHDETIGTNGSAAGVECPPGAEVAFEPSGNLNRLEPRSKRPREDALDQAFESVLEVAQHHEPHRSRATKPGVLRQTVRYDPGSQLRLGTTREWWNRQTRRIQVPVSERT